MLDERLPVASPACVHTWEHEPMRFAWTCAACGYELTELELVEPHEGEQMSNKFHGQQKPAPKPYPKGKSCK